MSKKQITAYICDRCKRVWRSNNRPEMKCISYRERMYGGGSYDVGKDLCPDCFEEYQRFIKGAKVVDDER